MNAYYYDRPKHSIFHAVREAFYAITMLGAFGFGIWIRFIYSGQVRYWHFLTTTSQSGAVEDLKPFRYALVGAFVTLILLIALLSYDQHRHDREDSLGLHWLMMMVIVTVPTAFAAIGHYWA